MAAAHYFDLVREMTDADNHRLRLVESARQRVIKPTARLFATTVPNVRKSLHRYQQRDPAHNRPEPPPVRFRPSAPTDPR